MDVRYVCICRRRPARWCCHFGRLGLALVAALNVAADPREALANCNLIPGTTQNFRATLGSADRPFASPGDFVALRLSTSCDTTSPGFLPTAAEHVVTVIFTPPNGPRNVVVLATDCAGLEAARQVCGGRSDVASATCTEVNHAGDPVGIEVVERDGQRRLRFRFPDTDPLLDAADDDRTFSGPATIAVTKAGELLPCALASATCADQAGVLACVDALFDTNGSCNTTPHPTFPHFTALPPPNNYQALCIAPVPPCAGTAQELRFTVDQEGNLLLPMDWRGILVGQGVPIARLLRGATRMEAFPGTGQAVRVPSKHFLGSYSPEGGKLPPIFDPQVDPVDPESLTLFGTADAPVGVLRIARRSPTGKACTEGAETGIPCSAADDCPNGACDTAPALFDFRTRLRADVGPIIIPRFGFGICEGTGDPCTSDQGCSTGRCVAYRAEAKDPVPLDGLIQTEDVSAWVVPEAIEGKDLNGDGDTTDDVVLLADRHTGTLRPIGITSGSGRATTRIRQFPFTFPAVAAASDLVAFLEPEPLEGNCPIEDCDKNADGDAFDTILRVFHLSSDGVTEVTAGMSLTGDAAPLVNRRSILVSNGRVFFRTFEAAEARHRTIRASVGPGGVQSNDLSQSAVLSADGRFVAFTSAATNLVAGDTNSSDDVFVHDQLTDLTIRVSVDSAGRQANGGSFFPSISADGRYVSFASTAGNLVEGDTRNQCDIDLDGIANENCPDYFVHDRDADGKGVFDEQDKTGRIRTVRVNVDRSGREANSRLFDDVLLQSSISANGRYVAFISDATNLVDGNDTNDAPDVFVHDRDADGNGKFDEEGGIRTVRVSVDSSGREANGGSFEPSISGDGRYVVFSSFASNLVPGDTNNTFDVFVHDRDTDANGIFDQPDRVATHRVSVGTLGEEANGRSVRGAISPDGRYVTFMSVATNLVPGDTNNRIDVFVHDRDADGNGVFDESGGQFTSRISLSSSGAQGILSSFAPIQLSLEARYIAFTSSGDTFIPRDTNDQADVFVHDRLTGLTSPASVALSGNLGNASSGDDSGQTVRAAAVSADRTHVAFVSDATDLVEGDSNNFGDVFLRAPAVTTLADLTGDGDLNDTVLRVLDAGSAQVITVGPADAVAVANDCAVFLRPEAADHSDLNGDGDASDLVVQRSCAGEPVQNLGVAATAVTLSDISIAALVSEAGQGNTILNGDDDTNDTVVEVHPMRGGSWSNTKQAADTVEVCGSLIAFITPEAAQGMDLNGDEDQTDRVLQLYDTSTNTTINVAQAAEEFACSSSLLAFRTREASQAGRDLNGDRDTVDAVLQIYDLSQPTCRTNPPASGCLTNTKQAITPCRLEACDPRVPYRVGQNTVTFLTLEADQGEDLNGDGDTNDLVLQTFNTRLASSTGAGTTAADARVGHRRTLVIGAAVHAGAVTAIGAVSLGICPDTGGACAGSQDCGGEACFLPPGGCIEDLTIPCNPGASNSSCAAGQFCAPLPGSPAQGTCQTVRGPCVSNTDCKTLSTCGNPTHCACNDAGQTFQRLVAPLSSSAAARQVFISSGRCSESTGRAQSTCRSDAECPGGSVCRPDLLTATVNDTEGDEIPDQFDNCPTVPNVDQRDRNGNGVGDVCDLSQTPPRETPLPTASPTATRSAATAGELRDADGCALTANPSLDSSMAVPALLVGLLLLGLRKRARGRGVLSRVLQPALGCGTVKRVWRRLTMGQRP